MKTKTLILFVTVITFMCSCASKNDKDKLSQKWTVTAVDMLPKDGMPVPEEIKSKYIKRYTNVVYELGKEGVMTLTSNSGKSLSGFWNLGVDDKDIFYKDMAKSMQTIVMRNAGAGPSFEEMWMPANEGKSLFTNDNTLHVTVVPATEWGNLQLTLTH